MAQHVHPTGLPCRSGVKELSTEVWRGRQGSPQEVLLNEQYLAMDSEGQAPCRGNVWVRPPAEGTCVQCQRVHSHEEQVFGAASERGLGDKLTWEGRVW